MSQATDWTPLSAQARMADIIDKLEARITAMRTQHLGGVVPSDLRPYEIFADSVDGLFGYGSAVTPGNRVGLWRLEGVPWATIPHTMSASGTIPDEEATGAGAAATHVIVDELVDPTTTITLPASDFRLIVVERRDASSKELWLGGWTSLYPYPYLSVPLVLLPGDCVGIVKVSDDPDSHRVIFEHRRGVFISDSPGDTDVDLNGTEKVVVLENSSQVKLPNPVWAPAWPITFINQASAGACGPIVPFASETIDGASDLQLDSGDPRAQLVSDGVNWYRSA